MVIVIGLVVGVEGLADSGGETRCCCHFKQCSHCGINDCTIEFCWNLQLDASLDDKNDLFHGHTFHLPLNQLNVKTYFLHGDIFRVYMEQPPRFYEKCKYGTHAY